MFEQAITHYEKRLSQWQRIEWLIMPASGIEGESARDEESGRILDRISSRDFVILLDEKGKNISAPEIAHVIEQCQNTSKQIICIIGGAYGVNDLVKVRANETHAFGSVVFPHQLMRIVLLEQLYRAYSINAGSGYHHL
jgi:23S rRNA (pseudouridine1915-N3)-methyltransferase